MAMATSELEARLAEVAEALQRLEGRVAALEKAGAAAPRRAVAVPRMVSSASEGSGDFDTAQVTRALSLGGRTLLVLAGAFVLRALTDSGRLPGWLGVGLGFLYAGIWMVMADRAGRAGQALSAGFYAVSVVIIGFPLLFEGATRFRLFSPLGAAAVLAGLSAVALVLAARRGLRALAWVVTLGGIATALALMAASGRLVPGALYLVLLGVGALWIGYVRDWTVLRWPVALVADLVALLVAIHAADAGTPEGPGAALVVQSALVALYLGSFATRTLYMGRRVVPFEMIQTGAVIAVGIGGAVWVATRTGLGQAGFGVTAAVLGVAAYATAFAFVERRQKLRENFYFYTSVAVVLVLAGSGLLLAGEARAIAWAALSVPFAVLAQRRRSRTLATHAAIYGVAGCLAAGVVAGGGAALLVGSSVAWRPSLAAVAVLLLVAASAWMGSAVPRRTVVERLVPLVTYVALGVGVAGTAVALLAPAVGGGGAGATPGALATLRTVVLVMAALGVAFLGRRERLSEWAWLAYPILVITGLKMLLEDLPRGRPATLILAFAFYGAALILVPRIRARRAAPDPAVPAASSPRDPAPAGNPPTAS